MLLHFWLGGLTALVFGLAAFSLWAAKKARAHRIAAQGRLDWLGRELFDKADGLSRRCDELREAIDRLGALEARLRLLELERELARLAGGGRLGKAAAERLEEAIAALRPEIAEKEP